MWWIKPVECKEVQAPLDVFDRVHRWIWAIAPGDERNRIKRILLHNSTYSALLADGRWESKTLFGYPVALVSDGFPEGLVIGDLTNV